MIKSKTVNVIDLGDWDELVRTTYGKLYSFQQQDGCQDRGTYDFEVPSRWGVDDFENETLPEEVNGEEMGVSFKAWKDRDPKEHSFEYDWENDMF